MTNQDVVDIIKAQIGTDVAAGLAEPQHAQEFIDLTRDQTAVLQEVRVETDIIKSFHLDTLYLDEPVIVAGQEGIEPDAADVVAAGRARKTLTPTEVLAAFDVSYDWLRKNILNAIRGISREEAERRAMQALNNLFSKRFGKDVVMIAFMGDTALPADTRTNKALRVLDGIIKTAGADADVHEYAIPAGPSYSTQVFPAMLDVLPDDYIADPQDLAFFVSARVWLAYAHEIGERPTAIGDQVLTAGPSQRELFYHGIKLLPVFGLSTGKIVLSPKSNLAVGFGVWMMVETERKPRGRKVEVTITAEMDAKYALGDALVLGDDGA